MIHITDGQSDSILDVITAKNILDNNHKKSLKDTLETFDFTTFADKKFSEHLAKRNYVIIPDEDGNFIEFMIHESIKYHDENGLKCEVFTSASYLELKKAKIIDPQTFSEQTTSTAVTHALADTEWQSGTLEGAGYHTFNIEEHTNPYAFLKQIATEFNLELNFRVEIKNNKVVGRYVDLLKQVGKWQGREITFGKDLLGIRRIEKTDNIVTALRGLGPERENGTRLEVTVEDMDAYARWNRNGKHLIEVYEPQSSDQDMTAERLRTLTENELEKRVNAVVEYESSIADLEHVPGMENKKLRFGDTIKIKDTKFNPPLYLEARIHTQERSITDKSQKQVELGDYIEYTEEQVKAIWKIMQAAIQKKLELLVLAAITSSAGSVFKNGVGATTLEAKTFLSGNEVDVDGTKYTYRWSKFDKNGIYISEFQSKKITVTAEAIDEKATYVAKIILDGKVLTLNQITISNVFDGVDGEQGIPGPPGEDGQSLFTWIKYADDINGNGLSDSPIGKTFLGIAYNKTSATESGIASDYTFSEVKGDKGDQGIPGDPGEDGKPRYTWIKYADDSTGTNLSDDPTGKPYLGISYNNLVQTESNDPTVYTYSKIEGPQGPQGDQGPQGLRGLQGDQGEQGIQGPVGADGVSSYTHVAYATDSTGSTGFSVSESANKTHIGIYVDSVTADSTDPADYNWTLIKGADGSQGIPGQTGSDGKTSYLHIAYATDSSGSTGFSTSDSTGKTYIGQYTDFAPSDSISPSAYSWTLIKGDKGATGDIGARGLQGIQGIQGDQGIKGETGADGLTAYTHIAYADNNVGGGFSQSPTNKEYIGIYVDHTSADSTTPSKYAWSLIKGADGAQGIKGATGSDGRTPYFHTAWANNSSGTSGFSTTLATSKAYIGTYTDYVSNDSTNPIDYKWAKIKGEQGDKGDTGDKGNAGSTGPQGPKGDTGARGLQGIQGPEGDQGIRGVTGADGRTSYTHIAYATNSTGTSGFSTSNSAGKTYIGMYVDFNSMDSGTPSKYAWSLIKGADGSQGIQGQTGDDGRTSYLHVAYANNSTGSSGFSTTNSSGKYYIGQYTDFNSADSSSYNRYAWTLIKGPQGDKGNTGNQGPEGDLGPQGPNIVDSTTEIAANVIKTNHLDVANLAAITANLGTVNAGKLISVLVEGIKGTFGEVSVKDDNLYLENTKTGMKNHAVFKANLLKDHSFESMGVNFGNSHGNEIYDAVDNIYNSSTGWNLDVGNARIQTSLHSVYGAFTIFGYQTLVVNNNNYVTQDVIVKPGEKFNVSFHTRKAPGHTAGSPRLSFRYMTFEGTEVAQEYHNFPAVSSEDDILRYRATGTMPAGADFVRVYPYASDTGWVMFDGIQFVLGETPTLYNPEDSVAQLLNGFLRAKRLYADEFEAKSISFQEQSAAKFDKFGNIGASFTASPGAYWGIKDYNENVIFKAFWGSDPSQGVQVIDRDFKVYNGSMELLGGGNSTGRIATGGGRLYVQVDGEVWNTKYKSTTTVNSIAKSFNTVSTEDLKTDIVPITFSALDKLNNSDLYKFKFKADVEEGINNVIKYGFIIGKDYRTPNEVIGDNGVTIDSYSHSTLNSKAIQELLTENNKLKQEIGDLKTTVADLVSRIETLENAK